MGVFIIGFPFVDSDLRFEVLTFSSDAEAQYSLALRAQPIAGG
jgi:hypothetical protein